MKLLVLSHISELLGGAERSMLDIFDQWAEEHDIKPKFIMREPIKSLAKALDERGWEYEAFDYGFWSDANPPVLPEDIFRNAVRNSYATQQIERVIDEFTPDVVITNSVVCPWAALAAHFQQVPHVWFVREYGDLDHGRTFEIGRKKTLQDVGSLSELVVANSKTLEGHLGQYIDNEKLTTLYTPFDLENIKDRAAQAIKSPYSSSKSLKLITTNNIAPTKGQLETVDAIGKLNQAGSDVELCIMGKGDNDYIGKLKQTARDYGIDDKVHLVGSQPDTVPYIALADIGVMASRKEAFGRATFECLAAGKPVVGADSGATPEMVESDVNGYLYEQGDSSSLARAIEHYLQDRSLLDKHGQAARQTAEQMMQGEHNAETVYGRIQQVVADGKPTISLQPIHYLHRWFEYMGIGREAMDKAHTFGFYRIAKLKLKLRLRRPYLKIKELAAKIRGA